MATPLELKRIKAELLGVSHAKLNLEVRVEELQDEIVRMKKHIDIQITKEEELKAKIAEIEKAHKA